MVGIGPPPTYNNIEALNSSTTRSACSMLIESIELLLDEGLELPTPYGTEFDLDDLLRMDTKTSVEAARAFVQSGAGAPNEARKKFFGLPPVAGGDTPYLQEQNFSLAALAERDANDPFAKPKPTPTPAPPAEADEDEDEPELDPEVDDEELVHALPALLRKALELDPGATA